MGFRSIKPTTAYQITWRTPTETAWWTRVKLAGRVAAIWGCPLLLHSPPIIHKSHECAYYEKQSDASVQSLRETPPSPFAWRHSLMRFGGDGHFCVWSVSRYGHIPQRFRLHHHRRRRKR